MTTPTPLDDIDFLARSAHRVRVLRTLAEGPRTRPDLHEETGVSQPTLGRVLGSFGERNWVERRGREYALTPFGDLLVEAFEDLLDTVETVQRLGDVLGQLPTGEMEFDLREFRDATVHTPDSGDTLSHIRRMEEVWLGADRARLLGSTLGPMSPEERRAHAVDALDGERRAETIVSASMLERGIELMTEVEMTSLAREFLESGRAKGYLYDGPIPVILAIADDTAMLAPTAENGIPTAVIETENETVRSWVETRLDEYREQSVELTVDDFPFSEDADGRGCRNVTDG